MPYLFLTIDEVKDEQLRQLELYGGGRAGILDEGRLDSAVNMPQATFGGEYLLQDVFEMGAAYLKYLVAGHAFGNANKRTAIAATLEFLYLNDVVVTADGEALIQLVLDVATRKTGNEAVAEFFRINHQSAATKTAPDAAQLSDEDRQAMLAQAQEWVHRQYADSFLKLADL